MASELDSVRPVHPAWPGRRVLEEGDESRRRQRSPEDGDDRESPADRQGAQEQGDHESTRRDPPPEGGGAGQHVDEYA